MSKHSHMYYPLFLELLTGLEPVSSDSRSEMITITPQEYKLILGCYIGTAPIPSLSQNDMLTFTTITPYVRVLDEICTRYIPVSQTGTLTIRESNTV